MVDRKRKKVLDQQWKKLKPEEWHGATHQRHREVLYEILGPFEDIEQLLAGHFGPDPQPQSEGIEVSPMDPQSGIAVATQSRVIFVAKGVFSKVIDEIPYSNIKAVSYRFAPTTGDQVVSSIVTGNINSLVHSIGPSTGRCKIEEHGRRNMLLVNIMPRETVKPFVQHIRSKVPALRHTEEPSPETITFEFDPSEDKETQLKKLQNMWEQGHITDAEMKAKFDEWWSRR